MTMTMTMTRADGLRRVNIIQGESRVSNDPQVVLSTVLGSCIAACLYDPYAKVGGMNHFLLAEPGDSAISPQAMQRYGVYAMEVLINEMLSRGAMRHQLRAKLYGGASMHPGMRDIGSANARFARDFLKAEGIVLSAEDVGGTAARRVEFRPALGLARCKSVAGQVPDKVARPAAPVPAPSGGDVEFF